jgi:NTP pyrophosphatase (non-canonical NTP hydrolase)
MNFNEYQKSAKKTALYPNRGKNFIYPTLGLAGETGEVAEIIKRAVRQDAGVVSPESKDKLEKELGDVLWYVAILADELSLSLETIAAKNIEKLRSRAVRGVLHGSGDNR